MKGNSTTDSSIDQVEPASVLLVDDLSSGRRTLATLLEMEGYLVSQADCGEAALIAIEESKPDYVLLDIGLPDMSGYEVASSLRSNVDIEPKPTLIALTGHCQPSDIQQAIDAGFDHHVTKPIDINKLLGVMKGESQKA
ncbi:MAG: response regulator [Planctomycetota bacterium]